jgi:hypothetical protein
MSEKRGLTFWKPPLTVRENRSKILAGFLPLNNLGKMETGHCKKP